MDCRARLTTRDSRGGWVSGVPVSDSLPDPSAAEPHLVDASVKAHAGEPAKDSAAQSDHDRDEYGDDAADRHGATINRKL